MKRANHLETPQGRRDRGEVERSLQGVTSGKDA